ncbi:MAG: RNA pseudouridine synthase, partial [Candidatus Peregrinibacteria bacterium]
MTIDPRRILFSDDSLLAVNKLSGELTVAGSGESDKLALLDFLRKEYPGLKPLHRLDFETSGVVIFARTKRVADMVIQSEFLGWKKTYISLVAGRMPRQDGAIRSPLPSRARPNVPFGNGRGEGMVPALTTYRVLEVFANSCLVEADITTGRHHQIRRHF